MRTPAPASTTSDRRDRPGPWLLGLATLFAGVVSAPSAAGWFSGDDLERIWFAARPDVPAGAPRGELGFWRPVQDLTYRLDHGIAGLDPTWFHLSSSAWYALTAVAVGVLAVRLARAIVTPGLGGRWRPGEWWTAAVATAWFAVVPSHAEAVSWISGRGDLLMTAAVMLSLSLHLAAASPDRSRAHARVLRALSLVAFATALLSKESAVALVGIVAVVAAARTSGTTAHRAREAAREALPFAAMTVGWLIVRRIVLGSVLGDFGTSASSTGLGDLARGAATLSLRAVSPAGPPLRVVAVAGVVVLAATAAVLKVRRQSNSGAVLRCAATCAAAAALSLTPVLALGASLDGPGGERLTTLASGFVVIGLATLLSAVRPGHRTTTAIVVLALTALGAAQFLVEQGRWIDAGDRSREVVEQLAALPIDEPALLLHAPDTERGAYVTRNGITASLALVHGWAEPWLVWQAAGSETGGAREPVRLRTDADGARTTWRLELDPEHIAGGGRWTQAYPRSGDRALEVVLVGDDVVEVTREGPDPSLPSESVWWFDDGVLSEVDTGRP